MRIPGGNSIRSAVFAGLILFASIFFVMYARSNDSKVDGGESLGSVFSNVSSVQLGKIPDTSEIVYISGQGFIYSMDRNGKHVTRITFEHPRNYEHAAVSFDHRYVIANEQRPNPDKVPGAISWLWLFDLARGTESRLLPNFDTAGNGGVDWDPQGFIYFAAKRADVVPHPVTPNDFMDNAGANDIYRVRPNGTGLQRLINTPRSGESDVSVSMDGKFVAHGNLAIVTNFSEIRFMNADGTNSRLVFRLPRIIADPELSPDNSRIVFSRVNLEVPPNWPNIPDLNTAHDIYTIKIDGTGLLRLTKPGPISICPDWKDDLVIYTEMSERDHYKGIAVVKANLKDQAPRRILSMGHSAKWIPR